jgi:hypothetical protein
MTLRDADAALRRICPAGRFQAWPVKLPSGAKATYSVSLNYGSDRLACPEYAAADVTMPPEPQVVWRAGRHVIDQRIRRETLLAALRQKYGKETGNCCYLAGPAQEDSQITALWWTFDERGRRVPSPPIESHQRSTPCGAGDERAGPPSSTFLNWWRSPESEPPFTGSNAGCVGVSATLSTGDDPGIVVAYSVNVVDTALAMRNSNATRMHTAAAAMTHSHQLGTSFRPEHP